LYCASNVRPGLDSFSSYSFSKVELMKAELAIVNKTAKIIIPAKMIVSSFKFMDIFALLIFLMTKIPAPSCQ